MIDWPFVLRSALWILGLSIALAGWSYASWWASVHNVRLRHVLGLPLFQIPFFAGLVLFAAGLAWGASRWWERALWLVLGLLFLLQAVMSRHKESL